MHGFADLFDRPSTPLAREMTLLRPAARWAGRRMAAHALYHFHRMKPAPVPGIHATWPLMKEYSQLTRERYIPFVLPLAEIAPTPVRLFIFRDGSALVARNIPGRAPYPSRPPKNIPPRMLEDMEILPWIFTLRKTAPGCPAMSIHTPGHAPSAIAEISLANGKKRTVAEAEFAESDLAEIEVLRAALAHDVAHLMPLFPEMPVIAKDGEAIPEEMAGRKTGWPNFLPFTGCSKDRRDALRAEAQALASYILSETGGRKTGIFAVEVRIIGALPDRKPPSRPRVEIRLQQAAAQASHPLLAGLEDWLAEPDRARPVLSTSEIIAHLPDFAQSGARRFPNPVLARATARHPVSAHDRIALRSRFGPLLPERILS